MDSDFRPLTLSAEEIHVIRILRQLSDSTGHEYGIWQNSLGFSDFFTSGLPDKIRIPEIAYCHGPVRIYHSHTNNTLFSRNDYLLLLRPEVERISVVSSDGEIQSAFTGDGIIPSREEYAIAVAEIEVDVDNSYLGCEWNEKNFYFSVKEKSFRISQHFKWKLEGGTL